MRDLVDTIFGPFLGWLTMVYNRISSLSVPLARPLDLSDYFGYFAFLGPVWQTCITTIISLAVLYFLIYVVVNNIALLQKMKNLIKWW
ncbi:hypothetical protein MF069_36505 [Paenibacillus mucilaginosus]|uniref:hypothetical protein n=1 Tax=Paenibacillus mucilaginosus TaxID=61624 RepID=UPI001EF13A2A|nr:hypothetical protein [Paenibacillus mucilaginosus]MCG7218203.1 hypothetical protein [Paenibacillus mucilaginosus]